MYFRAKNTFKSNRHYTSKHSPSTSYLATALDQNYFYEHKNQIATIINVFSKMYIFNKIDTCYQISILLKC
jgi:hypothetical protein